MKEVEIAHISTFSSLTNRLLAMTEPFEQLSFAEDLVVCAREAGMIACYIVSRRV